MQASPVLPTELGKSFLYGAALCIFLNSMFYDLNTFSHLKECLIYTTLYNSKVIEYFSPKNITDRRPLMCEVILVTLHCIRVKLLNIFVASLFGVALFRRPLHTRLTAGCTQRPLFVQLGGRLVLMKIRL